LSPVIIIVFLLLLFPLLPGLISIQDTVTYEGYYAVTAISLISAIPFIYGLIFLFIHMNELNESDIETREGKPGIILLSRITLAAFCSFIIVLPSMFITDAVETEGWLRSIYVAFLLALMAPFILLFGLSIACGRKRWMLSAAVSVIFLITVPAGLLLVHPWNYFAFFSPFYWISWAWVIASPAESILYGSISLAVTAAGLLIFYHCIKRNQRRI
jgi:hypothetical protein